jgi:hypothetical protein
MQVVVGRMDGGRFWSWFVVCGMWYEGEKKGEGGQGGKVVFDCSPRTKASLVGNEVNLGFGP